MWDTEREIHAIETPEKNDFQPRELHSRSMRGICIIRVMRIKIHNWVTEPNDRCLNYLPQPDARERGARKQPAFRV